MLEIEVPANPQILSTTVIAASSSQRIAVTGAMVRICVDGKSLWYKFGDSTVTATTGSGNEGYVPAGFPLDIPIPTNMTNIAIIQAAATAVGSVQDIG